MNVSMNVGQKLSTLSTKLKPRNPKKFFTLTALLATGVAGLSIPKQSGESLLGVQTKDCATIPELLDKVVQDVSGDSEKHPASGRVYSSDITYKYDPEKTILENADEANRILGNNISVNVVDPIAESEATPPVGAAVALASLVGLYSLTKKEDGQCPKQVNNAQYPVTGTN